MDDPDFDALAPDPPLKCFTSTCDQTTEDGPLYRCECNRFFCELCITEVDGLNLCPSCVEEGRR